jgi:predicted  nucleic acid-binding Zn-ribbon protein
MSDSERPEGVAFRELEQLVRHLGDELAGFRRRALVAEARLRELESEEAQPAVKQQRELGDRLNQLEHDNAVLRGRLEAATARTQAMLDRVRFIRQQAQGAER